MIVHIDCNNFFASCELATRPDLQGKPAVVANVTEAGGGVILALNNEAKAVGPFVISVDINSGMNGDTGEAELAVVSDLTVSIGYPKTGFYSGRAAELIGRLVNVDIGIELPEECRT